MKIAKWGNSLAVRLPAAMVEALDLQAGDNIELKAMTDRSFALGREASPEERIKRLRELMKGSLPEGYRVDRDEANER